MILQLSAKYHKANAAVLLAIFYCGMVLPVFAVENKIIKSSYDSCNNYFNGNSNTPLTKKSLPLNPSAVNPNILVKSNALNLFDSPTKTDIGGPSQPEMTGFKSVGTNNMVNLFTGDFSYNIPLLDVGGYPVNIYYDGGVGMEQEASWVGLGWNINPGNVNRNMRGVPDDFNGEDVLIQSQKMKPNKTWGVTLGADFELIGIKKLKDFSGTAGLSLGVSFNNYLGPALEFGIKGSTGINIGNKANAEKNAASRIGAGISINASSRSGVTFSPSISLTANAFGKGKELAGGFGLRMGTSYNSRSGIKALQISEQMFLNRKEVDKAGNFINDGSKSSINENIGSSNISFSKPSYIPSLRMPLTNTAYSGHFQLGSGVWGIYPSFEVEVFKQTSEVADGDVIQKKPLVGYLYLQNAKNNPNAVMDFTRVNDNEVTNNTPIISAPQYSYDVFSIQGEGTGGSIRAYRNDDGYIRDNKTISKDKNLSIGADVGFPGHYGANFNTINTPTSIGEWDAQNRLRNANGLGFSNANKSWENVYFRNPGESCVLSDNQYNRVGGTDLVRFTLGGTDMNPSVEPVLQKYSKAGISNGTVNMTSATVSTERKKRTQVTSFLNAEEAAIIGLDTEIKSYRTDTVLDNNNNLKYETISRVNEYRKKHHISQINVTEAGGQRYIYGIPVYNLRQKDFSFSVSNPESDTDKVVFSRTEASTNSDLLASSGSSRDGYVQITETPAYAHSFLLSGLLSPDYVDVKGDGITEDDLGNAVKFNYSCIKQDGQFAVHKWRTPLTSGLKANFNAGKRTEAKDDKGLISYGERESWYLHSLESKTMIALFTLENREDAKGATDSLSGINGNDNSSKRLKQIDLYSKADLKKNGLQSAKPVKTVHFVYSYTLCQHTPDNTQGHGKLTLDKIYFTFNGQSRANKNQYVFSYGTSSTDNPYYSFNSSDRWGTYKNYGSNPSMIKNADYPYSLQDKNKKDSIDMFAGAWMLKKILLPSGGQIEVSYESDDYAFVQDKRAADMMEIVGFGNTTTSYSNKLYNVNGNGSITENEYAFIKVPDACNNTNEILQKYLLDVRQLSFKLAVYMPKGIELLNSYATIASTDGYGIYSSDGTHKTIWVKLNKVDAINPLSLTAIEFLREQLPGQALPGYDVSESAGLSQIGDMLAGMFDGLKSAFKEPVKHLRQQGKAQLVDVSRCFVRLNDPDGIKYGGGYRVKSVKLKDNWQAMTSQYNSVYGQEYNYTTKEIFNNAERTISSGVASYEPTVGGDENPFQTMLQISNKVPLGPASYGSIEMPVLDAFFPSPGVGYSKVTVRSLKKSTPPNKSRSGIGKQVTEFYTAKDFPVYFSNTFLDPTSDKQINKSSFGAFFYKYAFDSRALSQGFLVETNDMHGKMKSQTSYPENDENTPINYTRNFYRNTGSNGLNEKFDFAYSSLRGEIKQGNMGIDIELMTDTREFSVKTKSLEVQAQVDLFPVFLPVWLPFIWPVVGNSENTYRAVTTTKVISYHSILDSVLVIDKGSQVSTKNLVYDAETGDVLVNRTNNEFNKSVYSTTYPAYWAYSGMGPSYKNVDAVYESVNFYDGRITSGISNPGSVFESGDELYLIKPGTTPTGCGEKLDTAGGRLLWAFDTYKDTGCLTNVNPHFIFINEKGIPYTKSNVTFKIVRSGKRNMLDAKVASIVSMGSPVELLTDTLRLIFDNSPRTKAINVSAVEYKEKWQTDYDAVNRYNLVYDSATCTKSEVLDCSGYLEKSINPYCKGLLGNFKGYRNMVFYGNRTETNPIAQTDLPTNGILSGFEPYWAFNSNSNLIPNTTNSKWVWNSQTTRVNAKGLELETKDALNIYTGAQYGYNKTLPVAIANNSRSAEMFYEGFEDSYYNETINNASINTCNARQLNLLNLPNAAIVNTDTMTFSAHTGKYAMRVNANSTASLTDSIAFPLSSYLEGGDTKFNPGLNYDFSLKTKKDSIMGLYYQGAILSKISSSPSAVPYTTDTTLQNASGKLCMIFDTHSRNHYFNGSNSEVKFHYKFVQYTQVTVAGNYTFSLSVSSAGATDLPIDPYTYATYYYLDFKNSDGKTLAYKSANLSDSTTTFTIYLCPGIYTINSDCSIDHSAPGDPAYYHHIWDNFHFNQTGGPGVLVSYKLLYPQTQCYYTSPIAGNDSLFNPGFSLTAGKKMLFSAWTKQKCGDVSSGTPCTSQTYSNGKASVSFNDGSSTTVNISPTGPIIEGWQRIEGTFTVPTNATTMTLGFVNSDTYPVYYDDIRLHPYNANMKSYVYDPVNLRLTSELDANNYASFYEYDEEGTLIRTKVETKEGIKTLKETRSAKQKSITTLQ